MCSTVNRAGELDRARVIGRTQRHTHQTTNVRTDDTYDTHGPFFTGITQDIVYNIFAKYYSTLILLPARCGGARLVELALLHEVVVDRALRERLEPALVLARVGQQWPDALDRLLEHRVELLPRFWLLLVARQVLDEVLERAVRAAPLAEALALRPRLLPRRDDLRSRGPARANL